MDFMRGASDETFDCCITDPPYGIDFQSAWRSEKSEWKPKILNDESPYTEWIKPLFGKMKTGGRLICFYRWDVQEPFLEEIRSAGFDVKSQIVWDKVSHGMGDLDGEFAPQHELIIYATKGRYEFKGKRPKTVYRCLRVMPDKLVHPNEKPVELIAAILRDITTEGENVFDPFGGSFSTAAACSLEKRKCTSTELKKEYFDLGVRKCNGYRQVIQLW